MGWFSGPPSVAGIDPYDLIIAAHELGHAVSAYAHGIGVTKIEMGMTHLDLPDVIGPGMTREELIGWLVGCWAGYEAEKLWAWRVGGEAVWSCSKQDRRNFRDTRKLVGLSEGKARSAARAIVRKEWARIRNLAPTLARQGFIAPW
jgi:hypothetical protein